MNEILETGVKVVSNQVQFSLIDLRPTFRMANSCLKHKVKLLTYGSLVSISALLEYQFINTGSAVGFLRTNGSVGHRPIFSIRR
jgi:hypothetical protein